LLIVGGGLFGSLAAAYARRQGIDARVFDAGREGAASPAAAGLFSRRWAGRKLAEHFDCAMPLLERLYGVRTVRLHSTDGSAETLLFVPPSEMLERDPVHAEVTAVGDGWLEAGGEVRQGLVYVAAGVWCESLVPGIGVYSKTGASLIFPGEREGRIRPLGRGRQALAFVRDPGTTYFSDGTAEREYTAEHDRQTRQRAEELGFPDAPLKTLRGCRPYVPGGPLFRRLGSRLWIGTGGRKMGTILAASFARRLVEEEFVGTRL
jgi:glycine/D-amino acid oxidase-like deaminating enzyme